MQGGNKIVNNMEQKYYTDERAVQILLSVLKANGIRKIIASPGTCLLYTSDAADEL